VLDRPGAKVDRFDSGCAAMSTAVTVRANMRRAIEESPLDLEAVAASTEIPLEELRDEILNGGSGPLSIEDIYRVFLALYPDDPLTFHEWFREPEDATAT
jgi:hypothetical protein